jgi:hypothetical protein
MLQFDRIKNSMQHTSPETDPVAARSKATATLPPAPTQHNSQDRLQIRKKSNALLFINLRFVSPAHKLNQIITEYGLTISVQKTKSMAFRGRDPVRTKIVIDNKIIEQVNSFNYLGKITNKKELDIDKNYITI